LITSMLEIGGQPGREVDHYRAEGVVDPVCASLPTDLVGGAAQRAWLIRSARPYPRIWWVEPRRGRG